MFSVATMFEHVVLQVVCMQFFSAVVVVYYLLRGDLLFGRMRGCVFIQAVLVCVAARHVVSK